MGYLEKIWVNQSILQKHIWVVKLWSFVHHNVYLDVSFCIMQLQKLTCTHLYIEIHLIPALLCNRMNTMTFHDFLNFSKELFMTLLEIFVNNGEIYIRGLLRVETIDTTPIHQHLIRLQPFLNPFRVVLFRKWFWHCQQILEILERLWNLFILVLVWFANRKLMLNLFSQILVNFTRLSFLLERHIDLFGFLVFVSLGDVSNNYVHTYVFLFLLFYVHFV